MPVLRGSRALADSLRIGAALLVAVSVMRDQDAVTSLPLVVTAVALMRGVGRWGLALVAVNLLLLVPDLLPLLPDMLFSAPYLLALAVAAIAFAWRPAQPSPWPWWFAVLVAVGDLVCYLTPRWTSTVLAALLAAACLILTSSVQRPHIASVVRSFRGA